MKEFKTKGTLLTPRRAFIGFTIMTMIGFVQFILTFIDTIHLLGFIFGTLTMFGALSGIFICLFCYRNKIFKYLPMIFYILVIFSIVSFIFTITKFVLIAKRPRTRESISGEYKGPHSFDTLRYMYDTFSVRNNFDLDYLTHDSFSKPHDQTIMSEMRDCVKKGHQMKLMKTFKAGNSTVAYWITNTDWSGFVAHDIEFNVITGEIITKDRFSGNRIRQDYAEHFKSCFG
ncbi:unnamed protein product [Moneuplotes crassus]|uniref:Uncharacterized protein n=1 Tax=Euplotes crassus TaxID=5936 RepID=A0AAD1XUX7_EUPCR|nr:unnamed protein product [Moneuplotes crassus]